MLGHLARWFNVVDDIPGEGVQYIGDTYTRPTVRALQGLLQSGVRPHRSTILSVINDRGQGDHAVLLETETGLVVLRGGLTSGYNGEGPRGFSWVIELLEEFECYPSSVNVSRVVLDRARDCKLRSSDTDAICSTNRRSGVNRFRIAARDGRRGIWHGSPVLLPFDLIDPRLLPMALTFSENPDRSIFEGFRRLEHIIRTRLQSAPGFVPPQKRDRITVMAFGGVNSSLRWSHLDKTENDERFKLFDAAFALYRNPRAHREEASPRHSFEQFMLLNMLYEYESEAVLSN